MSKTYEIWSEGYVCTGQSAKAQFVANCNADSFEEACKKHYKDDKYFDPTRLTYWGCRLFDNELDARQGFG